MIKNRILIGVDSVGMTRHNTRKRQADNLLKRAEDIITNSGIEITELEAFRTSFTAYFEAYVRKHNKLFRNVPKLRLYELFDISHRELFKIEREYLSIRVENKTAEDFNIYADTKEQIRLFESLTTLKTLIEDIEKQTNRKFNRNDLNIALKGLFDMFEYHELKPNINLIKSL